MKLASFYVVFMFSIPLFIGLDRVQNTKIIKCKLPVNN